MQKIGFTLPNRIYKDLPVEDAYRIISTNEGLIISVADGITRDPIGLKWLPDKNEEGIIEFSQAYPRPSPAKKAADLFCKVFAEFFLKKQVQGKECIREAFELANYEIKRLNMTNEIDYLENDFWACVACGGVIKERVLYLGYIGDCGVAVLDSKGNLKYKTRDDVKKVSAHIDSLGRDWKDPSWRRDIRENYRNNENNPTSYGALTGEEKAMFYIKTGIVGLEKRYFVLFYSDGMEELIFSGGQLNQTFLKHLRGHGLSGLEDVCKKISRKLDLKKEGSLVAVVI
ncbi:protein phosphatase 2C family protein [Candidatus Woesearchaeota archaeon]|nr:protein phosphatase 2C family protein [Candidatus Woesearchaeota archaeon]